MVETIELTPAQIDFIKKHIADFSLGTWSIECAGVAGSQRKFYRICNDSQSYVMVVWDSRDEDWARFIGIPQELSTNTKLLPEIYVNDPLHGLILEEDLGMTTLKRFVQSNNPENIELMYSRVLTTLIEWQQIEKSKSPIIQSRAMDYETFLWESWYFGKFCVTDYFAAEFHLNDQWEEQRSILAREASSLPQVYIHRDFQSENIMIINNEIRFVDFQGARLGPAEYDVASLLYDPYIESIDNEMRSRLFSQYCSQSLHSYDKHRAFLVNSAQRLMQALGAYGNLSLHKGKDWYRNYIPVTLSRLEQVLEQLPEFPELYKTTSYCLNSLK